MVDVDGNQINLTNTPDDRESLPAWSPDGTAIAFMRQEYSTYWTRDIFWLDLVRGEIVNVTNSPAEKGTSFLWSSDGKSIVFSYEESAGIFIVT
jgi:Tol biopolymer transport system component